MRAKLSIGMLALALAPSMAGLLGCGGPALRNAPRVNPAVVAAGAAAIAGAATLADPDAAARRQERHKQDGAVAKDSASSYEVMPSELLDRLDEVEAQQAGGDAD
jgi:hypothetical protein